MGGGGQGEGGDCWGGGVVRETEVGWGRGGVLGGVVVVRSDLKGGGVVVLELHSRKEGVVVHSPSPSRKRPGNVKLLKNLLLVAHALSCYSLWDGCQEWHQSFP